MPSQQQSQDLNPDAPVNLTFEQFQGVNTATTRPGVPDTQAYWLDGFMPLAPGNLRTLPDIGSSIYTMPVNEATSLAILASGTGGTAGTYTGVALAGGPGTGAVATVVVSGGSVSSLSVTAPGSGYTVGSILTPSPTVGSVAGFSVSVAAVTSPTMELFSFYNIGATPYAAVFSSDGSAVQVNTLTGSVATILPYGTITNPLITNIGSSQYGQQYLLIVNSQANGYWLWDGALLYQAGSLAPGVTLTNVGAGYVSPPLVSATGGNGYGAKFTASINDGVVTNVAFTNPGTGYLAGDSVSLVFTGGAQAGSGASLSAVLSHQTGGSGASLSCVLGLIHYGDYYGVVSVTINAAGSGYSPETVINVSGGSQDPYGAATLSPNIVGGSISSINIISPGIYGTPAGPTATVVDSGYYYVSSVSIVAGGSDYGPNRAITASGGGSPVSQATFTSNLNAGGTISSVTITSGGNYGSNTAPTLTVTDSTTTAAGTVSLMPFGISGTAIQSYQGHVWVFNGNVFNFSAPGSVSDFATSDGGGSDQSNANYLKVGYTNAVSTNGFLFLIGDSSMDYISGVSTTTPSGGSPTTTFTQNNCDPEIGTPYAYAVTTLGQDILIANSTGIFVSSGGAFVKESEPLDGVYNTVANFGGAQLSAAKATIFGKRVWMVLATIIDPVSGSQVNKLLMVRDRKIWWASQQSVPLIFIQGQEIGSVYTAWGTDGHHLYPLFQSPSANFTKTAQSKLWFDPGGYENVKAASRFWSVWNCNSTVSTAIVVEIDSIGLDQNFNQFTNTQPYTITGPTQTGYFVTLPQAIGQQGVGIGMTFTTSASDMTLITAKIANIEEIYRG